MRLQLRILLLALIFVLSVFVGQSNAQQLGRYIVTIQGPTEKAAEAVIHAGGAVIHAYDIIPAIAIQIPAQALAGLQRNPLVVAIEPDAVVTTLAKPVKPQPAPSETLPWGVDRIDAEFAHSKGIFGAGVNVAVVDTGIDYTHPDLEYSCKGGINIINPRKTYMDDNGHGTHVAGIIAAERDNGLGVIGVAPGASLYGVKVLDRTGSGWVSNIIAGLDWCVDNGIHIVNMSLGSNSDVQAFHDACDEAWNAGLFLVAAAGNDGGDVDYPAAYNSVIAVSATDRFDQLASWSSRGPEVAIAAPGVSIYSTYKGGGYKTLSGTSMAAPHVAGTLALSLNIITTADDIGLLDHEQGAGLVDAGEAATGVEDGGNDLP